MNTYTSIVLLGLFSISFATNSADLGKSATEMLKSDTGNQVLAIKKDEKDKPPHRGSGRREFFHTGQPLDIDA